MPDSRITFATVPLTANSVPAGERHRVADRRAALARDAVSARKQGDVGHGSSRLSAYTDRQRGVAQPGQSAAFGRQKSRVRISPPRLRGSCSPRPRRGARARLPRPCPADPGADARADDRRLLAPGCPVALGDLRLVTLTYRGFDGRAHTGRLVANARAAAARSSRVFRRLYAARFPIRRMELGRRYGGDDFRSIEADNTSAFNCRAATGSTHWSNHAYGRAIDVNPIENPYVSGGATSHRGERAVPRPLAAPRRAWRTRAACSSRRSARVGWGWGGSWSRHRPGLPALLRQRPIESRAC